MTSDATWMRQALCEARRGWGRTDPNPMVGAVVVRDGARCGRGYHHRAGAPHAEVNALADAGSAARGATLYVTLEPCCTQGRTPPCTEAILAAGLRRVVVGCLDPNPRHAGRGVARLRRSGIAVEVGVEGDACRELNEGFFCWVVRRRPFVLLKLALTLDGRIATASGQSAWITGAPARARVQRLRQWAGAIMVGGETVRRDNPSLTVRTPQRWWRQPRKLIWTRSRDWPHDLNIWRDPANPPRFVETRDHADWDRLLADLAAEEITGLLIEGGGELAAAALRADVVDKVALFVAPMLLGGRGSRPAVGGPDPVALDAAIALERVRTEHIGEDLLLTGYPRRRRLENAGARRRARPRGGKPCATSHGAVGAGRKSEQTGSASECSPD